MQNFIQIEAGVRDNEAQRYFTDEGKKTLLAVEITEKRSEAWDSMRKVGYMRNACMKGSEEGGGRGRSCCHGFGRWG